MPLILEVSAPDEVEEKTKEVRAAACLSGNTLVLINEVTLRRARLVLGLMTLRSGKPPQFVTSHSGQVILLPSVGQKLSTGQSVVTLCGWGVKAGMVHSTCG